MKTYARSGPSVTDSPSETSTAEEGTAATPEDTAGDELLATAERLAARVGSEHFTADLGTVKITVDRDGWVGAITTLRSELPFFSWLSAVDWAQEVAVGEPAENAEELEERYEVMCRVSSVTDASAAIVSTTLSKDDAWIDSLVPFIAGAEWHEREAAEMFGIDFRGNPNLTPLYLPDGFVGHPLRKSYPLLSREVKPWPGTVDVEGMPDEEGGDEAAGAPSTTNPEAGV